MVSTRVIDVSRSVSATRFSSSPSHGRKLRISRGEDRDALQTRGGSAEPRVELAVHRDLGDADMARRTTSAEAVPSHQGLVFAPQLLKGMSEDGADFWSAFSQWLLGGGGKG